MSLEHEKDFLDIEAPHKPGHKIRPLRDFLFRKALPIVLYGATTLLVIDKTGATYGIEQWIQDRFNPPPAEILLSKDQEGRPGYLDSGLLDIIHKSVESSEAWQNYSQISLQPLLEKRQSHNVISTFEQMQKGSLINGVNLLQTSWLIGQNEDEITSSPDLTYLWINHVPYNLQNRFELQLANSWVYTKLQYLDKKLSLSLNRVREEDIALNSYQKDTFEEEARLLEWLRAQNPNIVLQEGSFAFFPQYEMVNMARTFKAVTEHGYSLPNKIEWCGSRCLDKYGAEGLARPFLNMAEFNNESSPRTVAHEVGHLLSMKDGLVLKFATTRGVISQDSPDNKLRYVSPYAMTLFSEDFAETFAEYVMFGEQFRMKLEELRLHRPQDYQILRNKYDFIKQEVFYGTEFTLSARELNPDQDEKKQYFPGIYWSADKRTLEIHPDPNEFSGQSYWTRNIPILVEDHFEDIGVTLIYYPAQDNYEVRIGNAKRISAVTLRPLGKDSQASIEKFSYQGKGSETKFKDGRVNIDMSIVGDYISLKVDSLSRVEPGQIRKSRFGASFVDDPSQINPLSSLWLFDKYELLIIEGPQEGKDPDTGELKQYWKVEATADNNPGKGKKISGWIEELGIGKNISIK